MLRMIERAQAAPTLMPFDHRHHHELERDHRAREAEPGRVTGPVEDERHEQQVDADERERVEQPLEQPNRSAAVAGAQVGRDECGQDLPAPCRCGATRAGRCQGLCGDGALPVRDDRATAQQAVVLVRPALLVRRDRLDVEHDLLEIRA